MPAPDAAIFPSESVTAVPKSKTTQLLLYFPVANNPIASSPSRFLKETVSWYREYYKSGKPIHSGGFKSPEELSN